MLTTDQKKWLNHLSNNPGEIKIVPFDPSSQEKFEKIKLFIQSRIGKSTKVEHHGASSLGISGQDEIDVYIPVPPNQFEKNVIALSELFGEPKSQYPLERARFRTYESGKKIEIFVINREWSGWLNSLKFENHLRIHPKILAEYEKLKEAGHGLSTREYYKRKIEFINSVLDKT